jgi:hypothetical protein
MITGESEPVESVVNAADPNALEARNIIFNGSLGEGKNHPPRHHLGCIQSLL